MPCRSAEALTLSHFQAHILSGELVEKNQWENIIKLPTYIKYIGRHVYVFFLVSFFPTNGKRVFSTHVCYNVSLQEHLHKSRSTPHPCFRSDTGTSTRNAYRKFRTRRAWEDSFQSYSCRHGRRTWSSVPPRSLCLVQPRDTFPEVGQILLTERRRIVFRETAERDLVRMRVVHYPQSVG